MQCPGSGSAWRVELAFFVLLWHLEKTLRRIEILFLCELAFRLSAYSKNSAYGRCCVWGGSWRSKSRVHVFCRMEPRGGRPGRDDHRLPLNHPTAATANCVELQQHDSSWLLQVFWPDRAPILAGLSQHIHTCRLSRQIDVA